VDPTRWVFEHVSPYLYHSNRVGPEYDEGGNRWREATLRSPPPFSTDDLVIDLRDDELPLRTWGWLEKQLGPFTRQSARLSIRQLFWLANLPLSVLGPHAAPLFMTFERHGQKGAVPMDNWRKAMRDKAATSG
jgi:hypothetical protein